MVNSDSSKSSLPPSTIPPNSPSYLGAQDRPGDFITPVRLKLDNFEDWSYAIRVALTSRRKFGFLDGNITSYDAPVTKDDGKLSIVCSFLGSPTPFTLRY